MTDRWEDDPLARAARAEERNGRKRKDIAPDEAPPPGDEDAPVFDLDGRLVSRGGRRGPGPAKAPARLAEDCAAVLARWSTEGPLVHEPTGLDALDAATGGGPVYGSRWYIVGAPDAGKTALLVQIAHVYAERGIAVGLLAVDEEPTDVITRLAQRVGFSRGACELREPGALAKMDELLGALPIRLYDGAWTIEDAAAHLAAYARARGSRAMLGIDSVQTVECSAVRTAEREVSTVHAIEANVRAVRAVASEHRLVAIATSEMGRAGYARRAQGEQVDPLAAAKWSGAIEYSARVMVSLTSVAGSPDLIQLEIPKNKHGKALRASDDEALFLTINRASQTLVESEAPPAEDDDEGAAEDERAAAYEQRVRETAERLVLALVRSPVPIIGQRALRSLVTGSNELRADAVAWLVTRGRIVGGGREPYRAVAPPAEDDSRWSDA